MPTLPPTDQLSTQATTSIDYPKMLTAAIATFQAALLLGILLGHGYRFLRWRSESFIRSRFGPGSPSTPSFTPHIDAATTQPTRQSSQ